MAYVASFMSVHPWTCLSGLAILLLAFVLPIGILVTRDHVKARRQEIVGALEAFFHRDVLPRDCAKPTDPAHASAIRPASEWPILPSFEFVKTKYQMPMAGGGVPHEVGIAWYSLPVLVYVAICFCGMTVALLATDANAGVLRIADIPLSPFLVGGADSRGLTYVSAELAVAAFAFFGAYIASLRILLRSVANFDLSPLTFFRVTAAIISSQIIAVTLWRAIPDSAAGAIGVAGGAGLSAPWILVAFILGFVPGLAERYIVVFWRRGMIKRMDERATDRTKTVPLELIDGIDAEFRSRLEDFNLFDVQNLATANPIMLFVETPFGIYQSIDWVAQAQLAVAVGVQRFLALRDMSIRTIFDLEEGMTGCEHDANPELQLRIAAILLDRPDAPPTLMRQLSAAERDPIIETARRLTELILDDLAVMRLRQIWRTIRARFHDSQSLRGDMCRRSETDRRTCCTPPKPNPEPPKSE